MRKEDTPMTTPTGSPALLEIRGLRAAIDGVEILKGLDLTIGAGEVHAIMGPNGSGKSTLAKVLAGHPAYDVTGGTARLGDADLLSLAAAERALEGLFLGFQYPVEVPGVGNAAFLRLAYNTMATHRGRDALDPLEFDDFVRETLARLGMDEAFLDRHLNDGFSGGEKKRNEVLQLAVLDPRVAILDEIDSGLDIDALRAVATGINQLRRPDKAFLLVTHYQRLLDELTPDVVHVMAEGRIIRSGGMALAHELESRGYEWLLATEVTP
jgi:Fe-S cluster assembly ATP-binding protein